MGSSENGKSSSELWHGIEVKDGWRVVSDDVLAKTLNPHQTIGIMRAPGSDGFVFCPDQPSMTALTAMHRAQEYLRNLAS